MLCITGGNAIDASPSGRLTACHPLGAALAAGSWIDGTEPCGLWLSAGDDDWHPAAARAIAITRKKAAAGVLIGDGLDVAVTVTGTTVIVPVVVTLVALRDPAATGPRGMRGLLMMGRVRRAACHEYGQQRHTADECPAELA
jgi:hypothetical protein